MVDEMIYRDGYYAHPEYSDTAKLENGSETLPQMLHNVVKAKERCDFLGEINVSTNTVKYHSYKQIYTRVNVVADYLWRLTNEHREAVQKESKSINAGSEAENTLHEPDLAKNSEKLVNESALKFDRSTYLFSKYSKQYPIQKGEGIHPNTYSKLDKNTSSQQILGDIHHSLDASTNIQGEIKDLHISDDSSLQLSTDREKELIGIFSVNRPQWIISEFATYFANCSNCPLYSTFGSESLKHILKETSMRIVFASGAKADSLYYDVLRSTKTSLQHLICFDHLSEELAGLYQKEGIAVHYFSDILKDVDASFDHKASKQDNQQSTGSPNNQNDASTRTNPEPEKCPKLPGENYKVPPNDGESESSSEEIVRNRFNNPLDPDNMFEDVPSNHKQEGADFIAENNHRDDRRMNSLESRVKIDNEQGPALEHLETPLFPWIRPDDVATVCYTSGTSGSPKGVLLSHANFISTASGFLRVKGTRDQFKIAPGDTYLSYLPLAHVMERVCVLVFICCAARICCFRGDPKCLQLDMKICRPTFLVGVPRVFNVFHERINSEVSKRGFLVKSIFNTSVRFKSWLQKFGIYRVPVLDCIVFRKVSTQFGGRLRAGMNGSAPLSADVCSFLQAVLSMRIVQGYGQTEATAANILSTLGDYTNDRVGIPFPTNKVKLLPEEDFHQKKPQKNQHTDLNDLMHLQTGIQAQALAGSEADGLQSESEISNKSTALNQRIHGRITRGEICLKGTNVSKGYYKRPDLTKEIFTHDHWLRTGDIGEIDMKNGIQAFKIVGRRKEIFKTSLGEYIVPEKIENALKCGIVEDILITGKSSGDFIIAIVVCKNKNHSKECIHQIIQTRGNKLVSENVLTRFEIPRKIILIRQDFETLGEFLTPTMKKKRQKIEDYFKKEINELYAK